MTFFIPSRIADHLTLSLTIAAGVIVLRFALDLLLSRGTDAVTARRRRFTSRAVLNSILAFSLLGIWMSEIQNLVFSLAAVMVALVVATKELLMCMAGAALRFGGQLFKVGDRIEMNGIHGEVIDHGLFSTKIMELPPLHLGHGGTGRIVTLPNAVLLTSQVRVEAQPRQFAPHRFCITFEHPVNPRQAVEAIERAAGEAVRPDLDRASRFHRLASAKVGAEIAGPGAEVTFGTSEIGKMQVHVMVYCLAKDARTLEQQVTLRAFDLLAARKPEARPAEARAWGEIARQLRDLPKARENAA
ncbi:mechanosensitive ion channel family protein [Aurantimonas sp. Leaf443]|uniref:mechanosensitive ion channel family protein n=1 Tax=Aurantimonas sp. Leaf443 TaxID=1736378 RepID=UPI0006FAADEF|nr:mechanosensitive ion channel family protein [Aurantimonas sp. Leaf443]KQT85483.1 mechanosensitive ion channel protein MscS [Aurantimonas sp. Leaf443]